MKQLVKFGKARVLVGLVTQLAEVGDEIPHRQLKHSDTCCLNIPCLPHLGYVDQQRGALLVQLHSEPVGKAKE